VTEAEFKQRTKAAALRVIRLVEALPRTRAADVIGRQILRSGTSETLYWLELFSESGTLKPDRLADLRREFDELLTMVVASQRTLARAISNRKSPIENPVVLRPRSIQSKIEIRKSKMQLA
jgi:hypothetical protein